MATEAKPRPWTDAEKLAVIFQIIDQAGTINYDALQLPEGRTKKAVRVMVDRERAKFRDNSKTKNAATTPINGAEDGSSEADGNNSKKRKANSGKVAPVKKAKTSRSKQVKAGADEDETAGEADTGVKSEEEAEEN